MPGGKNNITSNDGTPFSSTNQPKNRRESTKFMTVYLQKVLKQKKDITIEAEDIITGKKITVKIAMPNKEIIVQSLCRQAAKGNVIAIKEIFDRTEGKVSDKIDLTTGGESFNITLKLS